MTVEPDRMHKNVCQRLEGILQMLIILEEDIQKQISRYNKKYSETSNYSSGQQLLELNRIMKAGADIRELRKDAQVMALRAGEHISLWWAKRNYEVLLNESNN